MKAKQTRPQPANTATGNSSSANVFETVAAMEAPLDRAIAYCGALELIGFGLKRIDDHHGMAILAVAEVMSAELLMVQNVWRRVCADQKTRKPTNRTL